ncbi:hypothetical protein KUCAC02_011215, partial [Chaenocephalus aceratus]
MVHQERQDEVWAQRHERQDEVSAQRHEHQDELSERQSVREAVGRRVKLTLRRKVQLEVKGDKVESRVLALASHRAYLLTARVPSK